MLPGYNTNGFAGHTLRDALAILSDIGYQSAAITLERNHLDPPDRSAAQRCATMLKPLIEATKLRATIETGSRFILDPRRKHQPTLISGSAGQRAQRIEFLKAAIDVADALRADSVSLWSGAPDDGADEVVLLDRLSTSLRPLLDHAESKNVRLSFEPEPGMFVDTMARFEQLHLAVNHPLLGLTLDVGHIHCLDDGSVREHVRYWRNVLWNVHIEDMHRNVHEHLMFGDGDMDYPAVFDALHEIDYRGPLHVELPRHSHDAVETAKRSYEFLQRSLQRGRA